MKLNTFTKIMLVFALAGTQISAFAVRAGNGLNSKEEMSTLVAFKEVATNWKQMHSELHQLTLSVESTRAQLLPTSNEYAASRLHSLTVNSLFQPAESPSFSHVFYSTVSFAGLAQAPELKALPSISAYPNPSRGKTRLALSHLGYDNYKIRVSNTIGKVVQTVDLSKTEATDVELDLSKYPAGVYFYSLMVNDKTVETKRLILQK